MPFLICVSAGGVWCIHTEKLGDLAGISFHSSAALPFSLGLAVLTLTVRSTALLWALEAAVSSSECFGFSLLLCLLWFQLGDTPPRRWAEERPGQLRVPSQAFLSPLGPAAAPCSRPPFPITFLPEPVGSSAQHWWGWGAAGVAPSLFLWPSLLLRWLTATLLFEGNLSFAFSRLLKCHMPLIVTSHSRALLCCLPSSEES